MAKQGSRPWAIYFVGRAKKKRYDLESDAQSLRELLDDLKQGEAWKPLGLASFNMLCELEVGLLPEQVDAIRSAKPGATVGAALGEWGGDRRSPEAIKNQGNNITLIRGTNPSYLAARLARDFPTINVQDFPSVRAAAIKAGITERTITIPKDPEKAAKRLRRHFAGDDLRLLIERLSEATNV